MEYRGEQILARVFQSSSDLYTLKEDGELDESLDIVIDHEDQEIVWYEVEGMEHLSCSLGFFMEIPSIEEANRQT